MVFKNGEDLNASKHKTLGYFSVAIFVEDFPPQEVLKEMLQRAKEFGQNVNTIYPRIKEPITITGYRLLDLKTETVLEPIEKHTHIVTKKHNF